VTLMKQAGCAKLAVVNDKEVYGQGLANDVELAAKDQGLEEVMHDGIDPKAPNFRSLAQKAKGAGADCFPFSGVTANNGMQATKDFAAALGPDAELYGPDGVCSVGSASSKEGIPAALAPRFKCSVATLDPSAYPPAGKEFFHTYTRKYGESNPDPYAIRL
jgi:branched-chain amino acid transport system substrate-binding protein